MKNLFYIFLFTLISVNLTFSQQIWINEFSYDCADSSDGSLDGDEFIEIVAPVGTDMSDYALIFLIALMPVFTVYMLTQSYQEQYHQQTQTMDMVLCFYNRLKPSP